MAIWEFSLEISMTRPYEINVFFFETAIFQKILNFWCFFMFFPPRRTLFLIFSVSPILFTIKVVFSLDFGRIPMKFLLRLPRKFMIGNPPKTNFLSARQEFLIDFYRIPMRFPLRLPLPAGPALARFRV